MLAVLVALSVASAPQTKLGEIRARGKLIVAVKNEGAKIAAAHKDPAHFQKRNFELELAQRIAARILGARAKVEPVILPRPKRLEAVARGDVDLVISMIRAEEAAKSEIEISRPYYEAGFAVLVRSGVTGLDGKRVALPKQNANDPRARVDAILASRNLKVTLVPFETFELASEALVSGKVDALISPNPNIEAFLASGKAGLGLVKLPELLNHDAYVVAAKLGEKDLLREVDATIEALEKSGELAQLAVKFQLAPAISSPRVLP